MTSRILILQGHPDANAKHFCHALADAYASGAADGGHEVRRIEITELGLPLLRSAEEWRSDALPAAKAAQDDILWADHIFLIYPLWIGTMPAVVKGFLEQVFLERFAFGERGRLPLGRPLKGRSARVVVTMGMPATVYRFYFGAHSLKSLEKSFLRLVGFGPVRNTVFGFVEGVSAGRRAKWLAKMEELGRRAE
jgi:putative NADPH-quinone reductase